MQSQESKLRKDFRLYTTDPQRWVGFLVDYGAKQTKASRLLGQAGRSPRCRQGLQRL